MTAELRQRLDDLAHFRSGQLTRLQSPRPKQFRKRLKLIEDRLAKAHGALDLNRDGAAIWERHLYNWAANTGVEGANSFFADTSELLARIRRMIEVVVKLDEALPRNGGRRRPYDDQRLFTAMADVFERAGGTASAYWSEHAGGMADNPFRRFVQVFYKKLPVQSKRTPAGVDEALRDAMSSRRSSAAKG